MSYTRSDSNHHDNHHANHLDSHQDYNHDNQIELAKINDTDQVQYQEESSLSLTKNEYEEERKLKRPTSDVETLVHLLKGNIGSGSLAMPQAFMNAGLYVGLAGIPIIGAFCTHCMHILLHSSKELCRRSGRYALNYQETAELSFVNGPQVFQPWSKVFLRTIMTFLVITQLGFCCVYLVFVSQNMYQAVECMTGGTNISQFDYLVITLIPVILVCYIPDLKFLAPVSMIASSSQLVGMIIIFYYLIRDLPQVEMKDPAFAGWSTLPLFFGTAMYTFEGIGLVLPLENNMKTPSHFPGLSGVLNTGMVLVVCVYTSIGFYGYLRYGDTVQGSITLNLPGEEGLAQAVKILMSCAIFLTYPLQFYVALSIMLPSVIEFFTTRTQKLLAEYVFRSVLVLATFVLAAVIPNIALFTNLVGAVCASTLALIFPPFINSVTFWPETGKYNWKLCKNIFISSLGLLGFFTGTYSSVKDIVNYFQSDDHGVDTGCY